MSCIYLISQQGSDSWLEDRKGAITASMFGEAISKYKSGANKGEYLKSARDYAFKLAYERLSDELLEDPQFNPWQAKRGQMLEPEARLHYEARRGVLVEQAGLALTEDRLFGASVDGLVDADGSIEIKCYLSPSKLSEILLEGKLNEEVVAQIQGGLWITGRKWCDFVLYCPALKKIGRDLTIMRVERDDEFIAVLEAELLEFNALVEDYMGRLLDGVSPVVEQIIEKVMEPETKPQPASALGIFGVQ